MVNAPPRAGLFPKRERAEFSHGHSLTDLLKTLNLTPGT